MIVVFDDPVPVENPALQTVFMAFENAGIHWRLTEMWRRLGHDIGFGISIARFCQPRPIEFEGRFHYAAIGTVFKPAGVRSRTSSRSSQ